jgi:NAD(P)H-dependent flavin oxidoreductase YrpB (nitropropane dioxygenase family)
MTQESYLAPTIIQGGMGVGVSSWQLARRVGELGQLGVVSGTAVAVTVARRLMDGDPGGHLRRALERFPAPVIAARVTERYLDRPARAGRDHYLAVARPTVAQARAFQELTVVANFIEVFLAKEGIDGPIGVNYLEKIQMPTLPSLYGAMLAGVDHVLMGAGVPARIPAVLDRLAQHEDVALAVDVADDDTDERVEVTFSPRGFLEDVELPPLRRPRFLAIVSSATLATYLARNASGGPDGFVVESPVAGGHNAPPRGRLTLDEHGEPVYGPRDAIDIERIAELGLPFWLAGGYATPEHLAEALAQGASGVQIGTAFALCDESGMAPWLKQRLLAQVIDGNAAVRTDAVASPTGFPFKLVEVDGTISDAEVAESRPRRCDLGYLREPFRREGGGIGYRCAAEPVEDFVRKGGDVQATEGRRCLCNGLLTTVGLGQVRSDGFAEPALATAGDDLPGVARYLAPGRRAYTARDVVDHVLDLAPAAAAPRAEGPMS